MLEISEADIRQQAAPVYAGTAAPATRSKSVILAENAKLKRAKTLVLCGCKTLKPYKAAATHAAMRSAGSDQSI
jgi:hypothetical protein